MLKIAIVDDHELVAEGFSRLINLQERFNVSDIFSSYQQTLDELKLGQPDLMLIDLSLPDKSGLDLIRQIHSNYPQIALITLSMYDSEPYISDALEAGASGYLSKRVASDELITAINAVIKGEQYLSQDVADNRRNNQQVVKQLNLTEREHEVFELLAMGKSIKSIASLLDMQPKTVHAHKANLSKKLGIHSTEEMRKLAIKVGVITVEDLV